MARMIAPPNPEAAAEAARLLPWVLICSVIVMAAASWFVRWGNRWIEEGKDEETVELDAEQTGRVADTGTERER
jgi:hypothetical protein